MAMTRKIRLGAGVAALLGACAILSGCIGGPTYGTDKSSGEQLMDDIGNAVMLKPPNGGDKKIAYQPRGGLVVPKQGEAALVQPQKTLASTEENPQWVESPEETRERLRAEADENERKIGYDSPLASQFNTNRKLSTKEQQEQYREARKLQQGLYSDKRRYLSDPPLDYRKMPEEAASDLGEPEKKKERRRKKEAEVANSGAKKWWPF